MKRYTLRGLIHDAKIFNQLRLEYRRTKKDRRKKVSSDGGQTKKGVLPFFRWRSWDSLLRWRKTAAALRKNA